MEGSINGKPIFSAEAGIRIVTDLNGDIIRRIGIASNENPGGKP
jgi:hypothetical protein